MQGQKQLARNAEEAALKMRRSAKISLWAPACVYDLAEHLGIEVIFTDIPSMEGMYRKTDSPLILVSSHRPPGRQAFNCAHELGHHAFKHGFCIDEIINQARSQKSFDPREFLADCFAGFLLMPKSAVSRAFTIRGWDMQSCIPLQYYTIAGWFGVGYGTLISHMSNTLRLIPASSAKELLKLSPKQIRSGHLGTDMSENLVIVDAYWSEQAIDIQVGDLIQLPADVVSEGNYVCFYKQSEHGSLFCGAAPGLGRFYQPSTGWAAYVRVSRRGYAGRSIFRHLEDPDYEQGTVLHS